LGTNPTLVTLDEGVNTEKLPHNKEGPVYVPPPAGHSPAAPADGRSQTEDGVDRRPSHQREGCLREACLPLAQTPDLVVAMDAKPRGNGLRCTPAALSKHFNKHYT